MGVNRKWRNCFRGLKVHAHVSLPISPFLLFPFCKINKCYLLYYFIRYLWSFIVCLLVIFSLVCVRNREKSIDVASFRLFFSSEFLSKHNKKITVQIPFSTTDFWDAYHFIVKNLWLWETITYQPIKKLFSLSFGKCFFQRHRFLNAFFFVSNRTFNYQHLVAQNLFF